jgi:hypothetical protein
MKKELILMVLGMVLVVIGALLKISHVEFSKYVLMIGLALEAYALGSLVIKALKK